MIQILFCTMAYGQSGSNTPLTVGRICPDFKFTDVQHYAKTSVTINDFRGQWLILDCWNRYCSSCLRKMPAMDSLQKKFQSKAKVVLIGYTGSQYTKKSDDKPIRFLFEMNRKRLNLNLTIAYDSVFFHKFHIGACPYIVVVDPNGIIRGITTEFTQEDFKNMMLGKPVELTKAYIWEKDNR